MKDDYPKTYGYLKRFEEQLRQRSGYKKYLAPTKDPFYSIYNVGRYTLAPYKVVWREQASFLTAAVVGCLDRKPVIPDHKLMLAPCEGENEAHYLCACLSSAVAQFTVKSYAIETSVSTHVLNHLAIPKFDPAESLHRDLSELSKEAHQAKATAEEYKLSEIQEQIDETSASLWGLTSGELKDIQSSLKDLAV